jgi:hypothetical protein
LHTIQINNYSNQFLIHKTFFNLVFAILQIMKNFFLYLLFAFLFAGLALNATAQVEATKDTFFLLKKKGLLKKLGESIYRDIEDEAITVPVNLVDPFLQYNGRRIRFIAVAPTGFYTIVHDTVNGKRANVGEIIADFFHKNTLPKVIRKNLFFKEGDKIFAGQLSDNERFLRSLPFMEDARIVVEPDTASTFVDVIILTRDLFSLGASLEVNNPKKGEATMREENLFGTGNRLEFTGLFDKMRSPRYGYAATYTKRNLKGTFINWTTGFKTYNPAFNTGRQEETLIFTAFDKPMLSKYNAWTGAAYFAYNNNNKFYLAEYSDSLFEKNFQYQKLTADMWGGFNISFRAKSEIENVKRLRHFVAMRLLYNDFFKVPINIKNQYTPDYPDLNGVLASYSLYKQSFYTTNFIYGFGRREDVPEGLNATVIAGFINQQGVERRYHGLEFDGTHLSKKGAFITYTFKAGTYVKEKKLEDANILLGINRFLKVVKLAPNWRNRSFIGVNYTRQISKTALVNALYLESSYGLPYFNSAGYGGGTRTTFKMESVFFNLKRFVGFRFAPFVFSDITFLKPVNLPTNKTNGYTSIGGGVRTRNENLVFGTIELRGYYFPRITDGMKNWRVEFTSKLRFNFNTSFIRKPEFVSPN